MRLLLLFALVAGAAEAQEWPRLRPVEIARGLAQVTDIQSPRDGTGRLFIVEQPGRIRILKGRQLLDEPFLDITGRVSSGGERGLLGLAFPPDYESKGWFYVNYTEGTRAPDLRTVVARFRTSRVNPDVADPSIVERILVVNQPFDNHNAGQLVFGPRDGFLYVGLGDGGSANDPQNNGQNPEALLGKMLRIDVESGAVPYGIPHTNPFVNNPRFDPEIWAWGLRNPWRFSFDRETGDFWIADVGQNRLEEVDFQPAESPGGENYGWATMEASLCVAASCDSTGLTPPVFEYGRNLGASITGGFAYRGNRYAFRRGTYFLADYVSGRFWAIRRGSSSWESRELGQMQNQFISTFGEDEDGEIYYAAYDDRDSRIYWLADQRPATRSDLVVNTATGDGGAAIGSRVNIYGWGIASHPEATRVLFDDVEAQLVSAEVINGSELVMAIVPESVRGKTSARVVVVSGEERSEAVEVPVKEVQPGIYPLQYSAARGSQLTLLLSGLDSCARTITVNVGGAAAPVSGCGRSQWYPGAWELMMTVPSYLPGEEAAMSLEVDGIVSPQVRLRIE